MRRVAVGDFSLTACSAYCNEIGAGFDPVRNNLSIGGVKLLYAGDNKSVCVTTFNSAPHGGQHIDQIADFGLLGRIFDDRLSFRTYCSHQNIFRPGH